MTFDLYCSPPPGHCPHVIHVIHLDTQQSAVSGSISSLFFCRYIEALRAQMKARLSQDKLELPPLCFCASSFLDSHPETCANNCIFHNNPEGNHSTRCHHFTLCTFTPLIVVFCLFHSVCQSSALNNAEFGFAVKNELWWTFR